MVIASSSDDVHANVIPSDQLYAMLQQDLLINYESM